MLQPTNFVLPNVGIFTLAALAGKKHLTEMKDVTQEELDSIADYLEEFYASSVGKYIAGSLMFTMNGGFTQPTWAGDKYKDKRKAYASLVLRGHQGKDLEPILAELDERGKATYRNMVLRGVEDAPPCAFTGQPPYLRVSREMLPMLNGRGTMNFSAMGEAGLPVSDIILLAIHALPLGCIITQGALLAVDSDDHNLMFAIVRENLSNNSRYLNLATQNEYDKFPNINSYQSRLITVLVDTLSVQQLYWGEKYRMPSVTAYHFSNYGANARVSVYPLPSSTVQFVYDANNGEHKAVWQRIVSSSWASDKPEDEELKSKTPKITGRYHIYEDLFGLPENAREFLRTYFLRRPLQKFKRGDLRNNYNLFTEADLISWKLTSLFLRSMMNMEKNRIQQISDLGTRLALYIEQLDKRKVLQTLYKGESYRNFRVTLLRAIQDYAHHMPTGSEPLVSLEGYVKIFEEDDEFEKRDWNLARDLLLIRIFEQLHITGYLSKAAEDLQGPEDNNHEDTAD